MPQYLQIADKVYKKLNDQNLFVSDPSNLINLILKQIRIEIKGSNIKLKKYFIEFSVGFQNLRPNQKIFLDLSLIPDYKIEGEFILWLAGFIEKITTGGKQYYPPLCNDIPASFICANDLDELLNKHKINTHQRIISYFNSQEFADSLK
ncbi:hypothetical protein [Acinetobacter dispersus]|uniref:Uncharacterized protein n=1 Tax=Acinetobacter dispersus TaxID=70348 RepID=N9MIB3_9GAMM|nr:hypothetical protein [Acinetobacter dispersus]ENW93010.1 hypothetical protein F904_02953 [Acinetobacter dispersus]